MVILNKEIQGTDMQTSDGTRCFYKFKIGLSKNANPNIFVNAQGNPRHVMMHIQRTLDVCLQDDTDNNAVEGKSESVDVQCSVYPGSVTQSDSLEALYSDPFKFWQDIIRRN